MWWHHTDALHPHTRPYVVAHMRAMPLFSAALRQPFPNLPHPCPKAFQNNPDPHPRPHLGAYMNAMPASSAAPRQAPTQPPNPTNLANWHRQFTTSTLCSYLGAYMKAMPACSRQCVTPSGPRSISTPSAWAQSLGRQSVHVGDKWHLLVSNPESLLVTVDFQSQKLLILRPQSQECQERLSAPLRSSHAPTPIHTSSTSALPHRLDTDRLPCLATLAPAAAATMEAPVEMLTEPMPSPPVPTMSTTVQAGGEGAGSSADEMVHKKVLQSTDAIVASADRIKYPPLAPLLPFPLPSPSMHVLTLRPLSSISLPTIAAPSPPGPPAPPPTLSPPLPIHGCVDLQALVQHGTCKARDLPGRLSLGAQQHQERSGLLRGEVIQQCLPGWGVRGQSGVALLLIAVKVGRGKGEPASSACFTQGSCPIST